MKPCFDKYQAFRFLNPGQTHEKILTKGFAFSVADFNHFDGIYFRQNAEILKISSEAKEFLIFSESKLAEILISAKDKRFMRLSCS